MDLPGLESHGNQAMEERRLIQVRLAPQLGVQPGRPGVALGDLAGHLGHGAFIPVPQGALPPGQYRTGGIAAPHKINSQARSRYRVVDGESIPTRPANRFKHPRIMGQPIPQGKAPLARDSPGQCRIEGKERYFYGEVVLGDCFKERRA